MKALDWLHHCFQRIRYPVSLPEEIAEDLGICIPKFLDFDAFVCQLTNRNCYPRRLSRYMPRQEAEAVFLSALRKDSFGRTSIFSYYFDEGWLEFNLHFDEKARLRRIYLQHKALGKEQGVEIPLLSEAVLYNSPRSQ